jgi:hypothetical protein
MRYRGIQYWFCISFPLLSAVLTAQSAARTLKIQDATAVRLSLTEPLSSATNNVDDAIHFEVTEDVKVGDLVAIPSGSTAVGHVVEVEPKRRLGRAGKLNFSIDHVKAPDGTNIRLRASSARAGQDKTGTVIVGTVLLSPLFLIMRGKDVSIPKGTSVVAYVDGDRDITLADAPAIGTTAPPPAPVPVSTDTAPSPPAPVTTDTSPSPAGPVTISLGQTIAEVEAINGKPDKVVDLGAKKIYMYKDMKITFTDGKVSDVQ